MDLHNKMDLIPQTVAIYIDGKGIHFVTGLLS
jgi:hypothetical protein